MANHNNPETLQLTIIHLTDVHFGSKHVFAPQTTTAGDKFPSAGSTSLIKTLLADLEARPDPNCLVIICVTGDLAETAHPDEFREAEEFIKGLSTAKFFGKARA